ncbi:uncharacterized protein LOC116770810 isoform X2 [Danaus plexippus]|nr:uncharacterized protein LOC116770810 isoform X2 [Danaus plexippus]XP_061377022.1 uncharacterized protein LOC116770810 isoform X2 [Danaus plexippus]
MTQKQEKPRCCNYTLKHGCVLLGSLNALISFVLLAIMIYLMIMFSVFNNGANDKDPGQRVHPIFVLSLLVIFILMIKLSLDVLFIYAVVKKHANVVRVYFFVSITICVLITIFVTYESLVSGMVGASLVELMFYSLDIITIFLSYFYSEELKDKVKDEV